jgi:transposase InsO family protein
MSTPRYPPRQKPSPEALFRFQVVSDVLTRVLRGELRPDAIMAAVAQPHATAHGELRHVSSRTAYRWLAAYTEQGLDGLEPACRRRTQSSLVLPGALLRFIEGQKKDDIAVSIPELLRRARLLGVVDDKAPIDRSTVYRACVRIGVPVVRRRTAKLRDSRRFAYAHRMQMALCDGKHFRAGVGRLKRVALFYLDDASRLGLEVVVGTAEGTALFLRGVYHVMLDHGLMGAMYTDRGTGFASLDAIAVFGQLKIPLVHGEARYPEGRGKIERFNRTALADVLRGLEGSAEVDADCGALELRLRHWLREVYNHTPHEGLGMQTPWQRFSQDERPLNFSQSREALRERFVVQTQRRVSNDHVLSLGGVDYEVPRGLAGQRVRAWRQVLDGVVRVLHPDRSGRLVQIHPVDLAANALSMRADVTVPAEPVRQVLPKSAATLVFLRDFRPIVTADGGFHDPDKE